MLSENSVHLRITFDGGETKFFTCPGEHESEFGRIDDLFSYRHATHEGWRFTDDIKFAPPGETVAVCPECAKGAGFK